MDDLWLRILKMHNGEANRLRRLRRAGEAEHRGGKRDPQVEEDRLRNDSTAPATSDTEKWRTAPIPNGAYDINLQ